MIVVVARLLRVRMFGGTAGVLVGNGPDCANVGRDVEARVSPGRPNNRLLLKSYSTEVQ